jgi:hypothetical protein
MLQDDAKETEETLIIEQFKDESEQKVKIVELYESDDVNQDDKKLMDKMCVICLEIYDENEIECVPQSNHINSKCECAYFVHRSCFKRWIHSRPQNINGVNCLVCSSEGVIVLSYKERIMKILTNQKCLKLIDCVVNFFCWFCVFMMIWELSAIVEKKNVL